jgi:anti-sigma factor RsiW
MRFIDGELPPDERARVEAEVTASTELARELAIFKSLKSGFQDLSFQAGGYHHSVWDSVNRNLTRPVGWILVVVGAAAWVAYGVWVFTQSPVDPWEKLAVGAVVIGMILLLASVIWERYRDWLTDPYRDVYR